jgi:hypothetical protein
MKTNYLHDYFKQINKTLQKISIPKCIFLDICVVSWWGDEGVLLVFSTPSPKTTTVMKRNFMWVYVVLKRLLPWHLQHWNL